MFETGYRFKLGPRGKSQILVIKKVKGLGSLQNRRDFLRILGEQRQKRGEREARVARKGRSAKRES